jgi:hypothetical protein
MSIVDGHRRPSSVYLQLAFRGERPQHPALLAHHVSKVNNLSESQAPSDAVKLMREDNHSVLGESGLDQR